MSWSWNCKPVHCHTLKSIKTQTQNRINTRVGGKKEKSLHETSLCGKKKEKKEASHVVLWRFRPVPWSWQHVPEVRRSFLKYMPNKSHCSLWGGKTNVVGGAIPDLLCVSSLVDRVPHPPSSKWRVKRVPVRWSPAHGRMGLTASADPGSGPRPGCSSSTAQSCAPSWGRRVWRVGWGRWPVKDGCQGAECGRWAPPRAPTPPSVREPRRGPRPSRQGGIWKKIRLWWVCFIFVLICVPTT